MACVLENACGNNLQGCCIANGSKRKEHSLGLIVGKGRQTCLQEKNSLFNS